MISVNVVVGRSPTAKSLMSIICILDLISAPAVKIGKVAGIICVGLRISRGSDVKSQMVEMSRYSCFPVRKTHMGVRFIVAVDESAGVGHLKTAGIMKGSVYYPEEISKSRFQRRLAICHSRIYADFRSKIPVNCGKRNKFLCCALASRPIFGGRLAGRRTAHYRGHAFGIFLCKSRYYQTKNHGKTKTKRHKFTINISHF